MDYIKKIVFYVNGYDIFSFICVKLYIFNIKIGKVRE